MSIFDHFPWTSMHEINLDWLITTVKQLKEGKQDKLTAGDGIDITDNVISATGGGGNLPIATASTLGGVKIGSGVNVTSDGTISVSADSLPVVHADYYDNDLSKLTFDKTRTEIEEILDTLGICIIVPTESYVTQWETVTGQSDHITMNLPLVITSYNDPGNIVEFHGMRPWPSGDAVTHETLSCAYGDDDVYYNVWLYSAITPPEVREVQLNTDNTVPSYNNLSEFYYNTAQIFKARFDGAVNFQKFLYLTSVTLTDPYTFEGTAIFVGHDGTNEIVVEVTALNGSLTWQTI